MPAESSSARKNRRLGRGLSSLITTPVPVDPGVMQGQPEPETAYDRGVNNKSVRSLHGLQSLGLDEIVPNPFQPRHAMDAGELEGLASSIRAAGVMQPIVVRLAGDGGGRYELVAGERRWRAARLAGLTSVPAIVRELSDEQAAEWAIVENVQRADLNPMERARAFRSLTDRFGLTHSEIAERVGLDRSSVANIVRLTELEDEIGELIETGALSFGHGRALLGMGAGQARCAVARAAAEEAWSVRQLEEAVRGGVSHSASGEPDAGGTGGVQRDSRRVQLDDLEKRLSEHLGTKVSVKTDRSGQKGQLVVRFFSLDHFDDLMTRLGFRSV